MKQIIVLAKKELRSFFGSGIGYIILSVFLLGGGLFLWFFPNQYNVIDSGYATLDGLFAIIPYLFLFLCPAITMRSFAEEKQQGTIELLLSRPITKMQVVLGKALGNWIIVVVALMLVLVWFVSIWLLAVPQGNVDSAAFVGSMIGVVLLSMIYVAIGIFTSSITSNQIFAFVLGASLCFFAFKGFDFTSMLFSKGTLANLISSFGINYHYKSISRGVIDSRDVLYFVVAASLIVVLTVFSLKKRYNK